MRSEQRSRTSKTQSQIPVLGHEEVADRAYQRYLERGSTDGYDIDDWLAAERELARERAGQQQPSRRSRVPKPAVA